MPDDEGVNTARFSGHDCTPREEKQSVRTRADPRLLGPYAKHVLPGGGGGETMCAVTCGYNK